MPTIGEEEGGVGESSAVTTETQLLNDALGQIGALRITAIDDGSINANHCLVFYGPLLDGLLRAHFWNFALVWAELAQNTPAPTIGYAFSYQLPGDFLRIKNYAGSNPSSLLTIPSSLQLLTGPYTPHYKIEGRTLRTNDGSAWIQYVRRVTNPAEWDALFYQTVATWLASKLASAIPKDPKKSLALLEQANGLLSMAMAVDGQEGSSEAFITNDLTWGR